jgi:hypothetical protein
MKAGVNGVSRAPRQAAVSRVLSVAQAGSAGVGLLPSTYVNRVLGKD